MRDGCIVTFAKRNNITMYFCEYKEVVFLVVTAGGFVRDYQQYGELMIPTLKIASVESFATM
jgi:hypothetical protein